MSIQNQYERSIFGRDGRVAGRPESRTVREKGTGRLAGGAGGGGGGLAGGGGKLGEKQNSILPSQAQADARAEFAFEEMDQLLEDEGGIAETPQLRRGSWRRF